MRNIKNKKWTTLIIIGLFFSGSFLPHELAESNKNENDGFEKGITWLPFKPLKEATFVQFDKNSYIDDYGYLASISSSVFNDGETMYCSPLLFYQSDNAYPNDLKYRYLDDHLGIDYLMEDWIGYCNGNLDQITTINIDKEELNSAWESNTFVSIESNDPAVLANNIALSEWSYSKQAVISVIENEYPKTVNNLTNGEVTGTISGDVVSESLTVKRPYGPAIEYETFDVDEQYKFIEADLWYPALIYHSSILNAIPGFGKAVGITLPSIDPDIQLHCMYENDWLQTAASSEMAITYGPLEECFSYVYEPGSWRIGVTNMPTEGGQEGIYHTGPFGKITTYGNTLIALKNAISDVSEFNCEITKYPGIELEIPDTPEFGCRNAVFNLTWDTDNIDLGLSLIGPSGEELESVLVEDTNHQKIKLDQIGECVPGETYKVVVFIMDDISIPTDFKVRFSWEEEISEKEGNGLTSACQGAILSSILNAPLLYTTSKSVSTETKNTLSTLGVEDIYIVDIGNELSDSIINDLSMYGKIKNHYVEYNAIYYSIRDMTGSNDIVFSTIDPWSYWFYDNSVDVEKVKPYGEYKGAFYFAPATYAAAIHGCPLLLVDNHPELSSALTYHNNLWRKHAAGDKKPDIAPMFLTGTKVYDFLKKYGFDQKGEESILTVAGQYDIGPSWARVFAGVAHPGAIIGTPIDASNQIARSVLYPALIFQNPALKGDVQLINGSKSIRGQPSLLRPLQRIFSRLSLQSPGLSNLKIIRPSGYESFEYPVLHTYGCYSYRFNERGSEYWGTKYQTRTGHIPGEDISQLAIDEDVRLKYEGKQGSFLPDLNEVEVTPFYAARAGYSNAFSTNFSATIENLNQGVVSWYMVLHGMSFMGGVLSWWDPDAISYMLKDAGVSPGISNTVNKIAGIPLGLTPLTEENPWRGYDMMWGSTEAPDSATLNSKIGLFLGMTGLANPDGPLNGGILKTGLDIVPANIPLFKFNRNDYHDGLVGPYGITAMIAKFHWWHTADEIDDELENLHSMSFHANSCLIACNYLHITMMRHGSVLQEIDPWSTSYWGGYVFQQTPKNFALGETVGESYAKGRTEIGPKYIFEDDEKRVWWWDTSENVVLFADPDLRIWIPSDKWDPEAKNHWEYQDIQLVSFDESLSIDGHMPFGATSYPKAKQPSFLSPQLIVVILSLSLIIILLIVAIKMKNLKKD